MIQFTIDIRALKAAAVAASVEEMRYYLKGVCVEWTPAGPVFVATDNARLLAARHDWLDDAGAPEAFKPVIIPADLIKRVKVGRRDPNEATIAFDYRDGNAAPHVTITHAGASVTSGAIDGIFPNWRAVVSREPASGELAQYDCDLLASFRDAMRQLAGGKTDALPIVAHNAGNPAIVDLGAVGGRVQAFGVIMPFRVKRDGIDRAPEWANA